MRGRTHLYAGWAAGMVVSIASGTGLATAAVLGTVAVGAALVPDIDHPDSTATTALGTVGRGLSQMVGTGGRALYRGTGGTVILRDDRPPVDGAHRGITHGLLAAAIASAVSLLVPSGTSTMVGAAVLMVASLAMAVRALGTVGWAVPAVLLLAEAGGDPTVGFGAAASLLPHAIAAGWATHLLLDAGTPMGIPVLAPFSWRYVRLPWTTPCGSAVEERVIQPCLAVVALLATAYAIWSVL